MTHAVSLASALDQLQSEADPARAAEAAHAHKVQREYLGIAVPRLTELAKEWREGLDLDQRLALASDLWQSNIHEARIAAAKLLVQARIRPDDGVWALITSWVAQFDGAEIADQVADAAGRRLIADPARLDEVEAWTKSPLIWARRATLTFTLPWTRMNNPKPQDQEIRTRVLAWAAGYVSESDWFMQKAVGSWLRDLSKHDAALIEAFLAGPGAGLKSFSRKIARTYLPQVAPLNPDARD
ncbi:DNA alkylation repair protein [Xinfangfangia sp. D13-10-4-6]|uniref:DNA alkylation repair protein n=1 Tax=Pseudogemmobacter hezensis TaxID=2737662 RepID=UPI0015542F44|nr:DNA alkylation repair protein [Pseudogemmobacter hezensis]NPD13905.1 DNA alkylation repair protein [Pseudogemmobacter hezensis]